MARWRLTEARARVWVLGCLCQKWRLALSKAPLLGFLVEPHCGEGRMLTVPQAKQHQGCNASEGH
jgi:hypothetical protein